MESFMVSPVNAAMQATHAATRSVRGESVTYTRGATTVMVTATRGSSRWDAEQVEGAVNVEERSEDWLIIATELTEAGITGGPTRGDTITDENETIFRVMPPSSTEQVWRWHDRGRTVYRIFSKERA